MKDICISKYFVVFPGSPNNVGHLCLQILKDIQSKSFFYMILIFFAIFQSICCSGLKYNEDIRTREEIVSMQFYNFRLTPQIQRPPPRKSALPNSDFPSTDWLKLVDGSKKIFSLSIPGTHETCARYGGGHYICQDWTVEEQLLNGVRYLDIRCRHISDCFMIHHGVIYQHLSFGSGVRDVCIDFLRAHPSEFIFMQIYEAHTATNNTRTFTETMQSYIEGYEEFFYLEENSPSLDLVRGKIVLFRRYDPPSSPQGNFLDFVDNAIFTSNTTIVARIQDCYHVSSLFDRSTKWNNVLYLLNESIQNKDENKLFLNFGSGGSDDCYPYAVAEYTTSLIGYFLEFTKPNDFVGVILFDYVNTNYDNVIEILAKRNFN